ncbi:hypothetical protein ACH5RR_031271 [Cinchona calisaya]|uniref:Alpha/beta hydrolase fold-3 domain-containing protein n=1 Tax=Cinchona calisaya TaxID=153742 RepID=A0ABD2YEQ3_9GENT
MVSSNNNGEVSYEFLPFLRIYKDGSVERFLDSPYVPPSLGVSVSSKDVNISPHISARIYIPTQLSNTNQKLPILAYFHGGGFCIESAFSFLSHRYINTLVSQAKVVVISVEYRLAPENPLPMAYEDSWAALKWIASQSIQDQIHLKEPWLLNHADFSRFFVGGDSAGANIAHNISIRATHEGLNNDVKIYGVLLSHPYFLGSKPIGLEPGFDNDYDKNLLYKTWDFVYPNAPGGFDSPLINPFSNDAPSLSGLQCSRLLICVAEKDELRERGVRYFNAIKKSDWKGKVELFEVQGEDHCFQILNLESENAKTMFKRLAAFLN